MGIIKNDTYNGINPFDLERFLVCDEILPKKEKMMRNRSWIPGIKYDIRICQIDGDKKRRPDVPVNMKSKSVGNPESKLLSNDLSQIRTKFAARKFAYNFKFSNCDFFFHQTQSIQPMLKSNRLFKSVQLLSN